MSGTIEPATAAESLAAKISNLVVRTLSAYAGRGPTKAWTSIDTDLVSVVLRDALTKGERSLLSDSHAPLVLETRGAYQDGMRLDLIAGVEELTGRKVVAFLSANHLEPDIAVESFVLEPQNGSDRQISPPETRDLKSKLTTFSPTD